MDKLNRKNIWIFIRSMALVLLIIVVKYTIHYLGFEFLSINNLFSGIIAANVFLMGFLLSGVISDYKESEKIPGEIVSSISLIYTELLYLHDDKKIEKSKECMNYLHELTHSFLEWFHRKERTTNLIKKIRHLNSFFAAFENETAPPYVVRLKNEMSNLNKIVIRVDTIRDTNFISSGYLIAISVTILLCFGLIFSKITPLVESLFFVGVISFLMIFLILLIHDLDDPFAYNKKYSAENVSLYPIQRIMTDIKQLNADRNIG